MSPVRVIALFVLFVTSAVGFIADRAPGVVSYAIAACALFCLALGVGGFFAIRPLNRGIFGASAPEPDVG